MSDHSQSDRLSWGDTVFLHLEREGMPLNVGSVLIFEGQIPCEDCFRAMEAKLALLPRCAKRVVPPPLGMGLPSWEYDLAFDLHRHVREMTLRHGTDTELKNAAAKLFGQVMDRQHPLWDFTLVHGLKGDRTAVIFRMHHCLADGIAGVGFLSALLDASPDAPRLHSKKLRFRVPPPRDPLTSLTSGFVDSYSDFVKRILSGFVDLLNMAERASANGGQLAPTDELSTFLPEITAFTERLRFNVMYRGPQKFAWADIPLADVKAVRGKFGTSVNDVILTVVTASVRHYLKSHGDSVKGKLFRVMMPVNLRGKDGASELGNRISLVPVTIPLDIRDPRKLLAAVHRRTEFLKQAHAAELVSLTAGMIGMLPTTLQAIVGPMISQVPFTPFNMVCTNVPGPQFPLYLLGRKLVSFYPYVPVGGEMALNCAALSYDGKVFFGFSGDVHAALDLQRLETGVNVSFAELSEAAGLKSPRRHSPRRARAVARKHTAKRVAARVRIPVTIPPVAPVAAPGARPAGEEEEEETVLTQAIA
jgi:diacylglycerol O-acyltransferase